MNSRRLAAALAVTLLWTVSVSARDDGGPKYGGPPDIVATLPKICWWLYFDNIPNTSEFNPQLEDCGGYTNHFCPALVKIKQAEREKYLPSAMEILRQAKEDLEYTLHWTENFPQCPVRLPAQMNLQRIKFQIDMLKLKAQKR